MEDKDLLYLTCSACITAADDNGAPRFTMTAYTGKTIDVGFGKPVIIDLAGIDLSRQKIPIFYAHETDKGVGHTETLAVVDGALHAEGRVSRNTPYAADIIASGKNGFPWQASVGGRVTEKRNIREGETDTVNGRQIEGPAICVTRFELKEISFVELGADDQTSASIAAKLSTTEDKMEETKTPLNEELKAGAADAVYSGLGSGEKPDVQKIVAAEVTKAVDEVRAAYEKKDAERERVAEIKARNTYGNTELEAQAINEGWTADKFELEALRASRAAVPFVPTGGGEYSGEQLEAAALMASGLSNDRIAKAFKRGDDVLTASERLRGIGLRELVEIAAHQKGVHLGEFRHNESGWLKAAFSTAGVSGLLSNTLNKGLLEWYNTVEQNWKAIASETSTRDFKQYEQYYFTTNFGFEEVAPDGEIKHGQIGEEKFVNQAKTYGTYFAISRTMLINDDLGALMEIPRRLGFGAARTLAKRVWQTLLSNPLCADGNNFFR